MHFDIEVPKRSTLVMDCIFTDEDDNLVVPKTNILWNTYTENGVDLANGTVAASANASIVLSGAAINAGGAGITDVVFISIRSTYDSTLQNDLPLEEIHSFTVLDVPGQL